MKIYFDGCSMTRGGHYLGGKDYKERRYSKLLCNKLNAEEYNYSINCGSNQRILRNLANEHFDEQYDLAIIQLTFISRTEFYDGEKYIPINSHVVRRGDGSYHINRANQLATRDKRFTKNGTNSVWWLKYFSEIYDDTYGYDYEKTVYNSIKSICKVKKLPLIIMSCYKSTKLDYDLMITPENYEVVSENNKHPNINGHAAIADDIYNLL